MGYQKHLLALCLLWMNHQSIQVSSLLFKTIPSLFNHASLQSSAFQILHQHTERLRLLRVHSVQKYDDDDDDMDDDDFFVGDSLDDETEMEFGKFAVTYGDEDVLSPLPQFLSNLNETAIPPLTLQRNLLDETQKRIEQQQKQIDALMQAINTQKTSIAPSIREPQKRDDSDTTRETLMELSEEEMVDSMSRIDPAISSTQLLPQQVAPLRVMLFIDGTWLYYSIFERPAHLCPIVAKYGRGWQQNYRFKWGELPRIVCEALQEQEQNMRWSGSNIVRPMEISRATVFTSVKKNTNVKSDRIQMFEDMKSANYDVYMMETVGSGEKCVDIQLAVEMLHYATVPNAYDVAVLVSGDKDFMPALIRTRQKARKVGIVSKRPDCNRALYQTPNLIDYDVIWFEDYLDRLITVKAGVDVESISNTPDISRFTVIKVIYDFIAKSNLPMVSSRDVGRYLKQFPIGQSDVQTELKRQFRGLHQIVRDSEVFSIQKVESKIDKTFWISLSSNAEDALLEEARRARLTDLEREFFDTYSLDQLDFPERAYEFSILELGKIRPSLSPHHFLGTRSELHSHDLTSSTPTLQHNELSSVENDYSTYTVVQLKELCRERDLAVSGVKSLLITRLHEDDQRKQARVPLEAATTITPLAAATEYHNNHKKNPLPIPPSADSAAIVPPSPVAEYSINLVKEYIHASGGTASSRDIGRYLNANASFAVRQKQGGLGNSTALSELKSIYGSLARFINTHDNIFERTAAVDREGNFEFQVRIKSGDKS